MAAGFIIAWAMAFSWFMVLSELELELLELELEPFPLEPPELVPEP